MRHRRHGSCRRGGGSRPRLLFELREGKAGRDGEVSGTFVRPSAELFATRRVDGETLESSRGPSRRSSGGALAREGDDPSSAAERGGEPSA
jgi:hypothetical protein